MSLKSTWLKHAIPGAAAIALSGSLCLSGMAAQGADESEAGYTAAQAENVLSGSVLPSTEVIAYYLHQNSIITETQSDKIVSAVQAWAAANAQELPRIFWEHRPEQGEHDPRPAIALQNVSPTLADITSRADFTNGCIIFENQRREDIVNGICEDATVNRLHFRSTSPIVARGRADQGIADNSLEMTVVFPERKVYFHGPMGADAQEFALDSFSPNFRRSLQALTATMRVDLLKNIQFLSARVAGNWPQIERELDTWTAQAPAAPSR